MIYAPTSRVEIYKTDRYKEVSLHDELGVYAVKNLEEGTILDELQGSVVKFPKSWEADLERGRTRDLNDDEEHSEDEDEDDSGMEQEDGGRNRKRKPSVPQRRSERTGRRDFSVLRSALKGCLQLFLGPARFLNVSDLPTSARRLSESPARLREQRRAISQGQLRDLQGRSSNQDRTRTNHLLVSAS